MYEQRHENYKNYFICKQCSIFTAYLANALIFNTIKIKDHRYVT